MLIPSLVYIYSISSLTSSHWPMIDRFMAVRDS